MHQVKDAEGGRAQGRSTNVQRMHREERRQHTTSIKHSAFWKLSERKRTERGNRNTCSTSRILAGEAREEAVVDSGAVECVTSRKSMPHSRVEETPEPDRREIMPLAKDRGMFTLDTWIGMPTNRSSAESCSCFTRQR